MTRCPLASVWDSYIYVYFLGFLEVLDIFLSFSTSSESEDSMLSLPWRFALDLRERKRSSLRIAAVVCGLIWVAWRGGRDISSLRSLFGLLGGVLLVLSLLKTADLVPILAFASFVL